MRSLFGTSAGARGDRRYRIALAASALAATWALPAQAEGQSRTVISSKPECEQCRLVFEHVLWLGDDNGPGALTRVSSVAHDSHGRFFVTSYMDREPLRVFDQRGEFLREVGKYGGGPGEFRSMRFAHVGRGDSLWVFDPLNARISILAPSLEVIRIVAFHGLPREAFRLSDGRLVIAALLPTPANIGLPVHLLEIDGTITRSFGNVEAIRHPSRPFLTIRSIAPAGTGRVWVAHKTQYVIELWDTAGVKLKELVRDASWFRPYSEVRSTTPERPPQPTLSSLRQARSGRLWVMIHVADADWQLGLEPASPTPEGRGYRIRNPDSVFDTVVEIIDPANGRLIFSRRFPEYLGGFLDGDHVLTSALDENGFVRIRVLRAQLHQ